MPKKSKPTSTATKTKRTKTPKAAKSPTNWTMTRIETPVHKQLEKELLKDESYSQCIHRLLDEVHEYRRTSTMKVQHK